MSSVTSAVAELVVCTGPWGRGGALSRVELPRVRPLSCQRVDVLMYTACPYPVYGPCCLYGVHHKAQQKTNTM